jgi:hypothetical protein
MKNDSKENDMRRVTKLGCTAMAMLMLAGCGAVSADVIGENDYNVDGTYRMEVASGDEDSSVWAYNFSKDDMTFSETVTIGENVYELASGSYDINAEDDLVQTVDQKDEKQDFVIYGEYLLVDGYFYEGEIPDGTTFDMTCVHSVDDETVSKIEFKSDGSYTYTGSVKSTGTYQREGDVIELTATEGTSLVNFIIYKGKITNSYYIKNK